MVTILKYVNWLMTVIIAVIDLQSGINNTMQPMNLSL